MTDIHETLARLDELEAKAAAAHLRRQEEQLAKAREIIEAVTRGYSGLTVKHRAAAWLAANNEGVSDGRG